MFETQSKFSSEITCHKNREGHKIDTMWTNNTQLWCIRCDALKFSFFLRSPSASSVIGMLKSFCFDVFKMSMRLLYDTWYVVTFWWISRNTFYSSDRCYTLRLCRLLYVWTRTLQELHHCSESMLLIVGTLLASWESTMKNLMSRLHRNEENCKVHYVHEPAD
jgi:hypothetical protein